MARTDPQLNIRIPAELKAKIEECAKASGRSATAEIIKRLESTFSTDRSMYSFDGLSAFEVDHINQLIRIMKMNKEQDA